MLNKAIERIEKIKDFCENTSVELSLFSKGTLKVETVIRWLDKIADALEEIETELRDK